ncbi:hypothetical protein D3C81_1270830 [compost metagenome]
MEHFIFYLRIDGNGIAFPAFQWADQGGPFQQMLEAQAQIGRGGKAFMAAEEVSQQLADDERRQGLMLQRLQGKVKPRHMDAA